MPRITVPAADAIIDQPIKCLNYGHVTLKDYLGGDAMIVKSARVSYGLGTDTPERDKGLISYLLRNRHTSPFEQTVLTYHIKCPIVIERQFVRHRMARMNEISGRYTQMKDEFYVPEPQDIQPQSKDNKQGRMDDGSFTPELKNAFSAEFQQEQKLAYERYQGRLDSGMAKELARMNLPLSLYTEKYWQMDLNNLFRFLALRMDSHAMYEIRVYANAIYELAKSVAPWACEAFEEHIWGSKTFSKKEWALIQEERKSSRMLWTNEHLEAKLGKTGAVDFLKKLGEGQ